MLSLAQRVQQARYVSFATFRKNGAKVATPVWMAPAELPPKVCYIFSAGNAGKVKRLRNNPVVELACCDVQGKVLSDWITATAQLVTEPDEIALALEALGQKYGWQMWIADVGSKLTGKYHKRAYIRVQLNQLDPGSLQPPS